ncbi:MAG: hypothetical protein HQM08_22445 [Candidatus Riflebacteria bacterium]|nr:hypothetical protein [Candidatus Riflebacteria bacterium]
MKNNSFYYENTILKLERKLPIKGKVLVSEGETVSFDSIIAKAPLPEMSHLINLPLELNCDPYEVIQFLKKKDEEIVQIGEIIAETPGVFGFLKTQVISKFSGKIEISNDGSGTVLIREPSKNLEVPAFADGLVTSILPCFGAELQVHCDLIYGIAGFGGEQTGILEINDEILDSHQGKIVVKAGLTSEIDLIKASEKKVAGLVIGGIEIQILEKFLEKDIVFPLTGDEKLGFSIILTEGFGRLTVNEVVYRILSENSGKIASINASTQVRAGVKRPIIVFPKALSNVQKVEHPDCAFSIGQIVRITAGKHFAAIGKISEIPSGFFEIETEASVKIAKVKIKGFDDSIIVPLKNMEILR